MSKGLPSNAIILVNFLSFDKVGCIVHAGRSFQLSFLSKHVRNFQFPRSLFFLFTFFLFLSLGCLLLMVVVKQVLSSCCFSLLVYDCLAIDVF